MDGDAIVLKKHRPAGSCDFCGEVDEQAIQFLSLIHIFSGVGEKKAARYGNAFLRVIEDAVGSRE